MSRKKGNNKGFSLIELIIAITIIAIISGVAIMAFGGIFSTKVTAAAKSIQDALKQTRIDALGMENNNIYTATDESGNVTYQKTAVYAKFYCNSNGVYVDVCTKKNDSDTEKIIHSNKISNAEYDLEFWNEGDDNPVLKITKGSSYGTKLYFKKSTGGVAGFEVVKDINTSTENVESTANGINYLKVVGPGSDNTETIYIVKITGRCYIDV